jgi:hypothetical protein
MPIAGQGEVAPQTKVRNFTGGVFPSCVYRGSRTQQANTDQQKNCVPLPGRGKQIKKKK